MNVLFQEKGLKALALQFIQVFHPSFINLVLHVCMKINKLDVTAFAILYKLSVQAIQVIILCQQYRL